MADIKIRSEEEKKDFKFNYYFVLGLAANAPQAEIDKAVAKLGGQTLNTSDLYKKRLGELQADIKAVMANPDAKKGEAEKATEFRKKTFQEAISFFASRGFIYKSEIDKQATVNLLEYNSAYDAVKHLFTANANVKFYDDTTGMEKYNQFAKIIASLKILNLNNLYEFYEVSSSATPLEIKNSHIKIVAKYKSRTDAVGTAAKELHSGAFLKIITEPKDKKDYDFLISIQTEVWDVLEKLKASSITQIHLDKKVEFIAAILKKNKNLKMDDAERELGGLFKKFNIRVDIPEKGNSTIKLCGKCGAPYIYDAKAKACPVCHTLFVAPCWNCGKEIKTDEGSVCANCSADIKQADAFFKDTTDLSRTMRLWDIDLLHGSIRKFDLKYGAFKKQGTEVQKRFDEAKKELTRKEGIKKQYFDSIDKVIVNKEFFTANAVLGELKKDAPTCDVSSYEQKINPALAEVRKLLQIINTAKDEMSAITAYKKIFEVCRDCNDAKNIIHKYPPASPARLTVAVKADGIELAWQVPQVSDNIVYSIIRKRGGVPSDKTDGEVIKSVYSGTIFVDKTAQNAIPYGYAVFASRYGATSQLSVTQPVAKRSDVIITEQKVIPGGIAVMWKAVEGVSEILVYRSNDMKPPSRVGDGVKISVGEKGFSDATLPKTGLYGYLIVCAYKIGSVVSYSKGIRETYEYYEKPSQVENVKYTENANGSFTATFNELKVGKFDVYASLTPVKNLKPQEYYPLSELKKLIEIDCFNLTSKSADFFLPLKESYYIYPGCVEREEFAVGNEFLLFKKEPFKNVRLKEESNNYFFEFDWDCGAEYAVVAINTTDYEKNSAAVGQKYTKEQFQKNGNIPVKQLYKAMNYITLYALYPSIREENETGAESFKATVDYNESLQVNYTVNADERKMQIDFTFVSDRQAILSDLSVVANKKKPLNRNDGNIVGEIKTLTLKKGLFSKTFSAKYTLKPTVFSAVMSYAVFSPNGKILFKRG
jgi:hypothetical protein